MDRSVICIDNRGYRASLEMGKPYVTIPDPDAEHRGLVRVVDESGEDYLFPIARFASRDEPSPGDVGRSAPL